MKGFNEIYFFAINVVFRACHGWKIDQYKLLQQFLIKDASIKMIPVIEVSVRNCCRINFQRIPRNIRMGKFYSAIKFHYEAKWKATNSHYGRRFSHRANNAHILQPNWTFFCVMQWGHNVSHFTKAHSRSDSRFKHIYVRWPNGNFWYFNWKSFSAALQPVLKSNPQ